MKLKLLMKLHSHNQSSGLRHQQSWIICSYEFHIALEALVVVLIISLEVELVEELAEAPVELQGCLDHRHLEPEGLVAPRSPMCTSRRGNLLRVPWGKTLKFILHCKWDCRRECSTIAQGTFRLRVDRSMDNIPLASTEAWLWPSCPPHRVWMMESSRSVHIFVWQTFPCRSIFFLPIWVAEHPSFPWNPHLLSP